MEDRFAWGDRHGGTIPLLLAATARPVAPMSAGDAASRPEDLGVLPREPPPTDNPGTARRRAAPHDLPIGDRLSSGMAAPGRWPPFPDSWRRRARGRSVRTYLVGLIFAVLVPVLGFSTVLVLLSAEREQNLMASTVRERAEAASVELDLLLATVRARLFAIANAGTADGDAIEALYERARQPIDHHRLMVVLTAASGRKIFNTNAQYGDLLAPDTDESADRRVIETGLPFISNLRISAFTGKPAVTVNVPIMRSGAVAYVLSANILPLLGDLIARLNLPPDWLGAISDRNGYIMVRTRAGDRFVGQMVSQRFLGRVRAADEGWFSGVSRDGVPSYVGFSHARLAGWTVALAIPAKTLLRPVRHLTRILVLAGLSILALALLAAFIIGRRISRPIMRLVADAQAVGAGAPAGLAPTGLRETDAVARSLFQASERLIRQAAERDEASARLAENEQRFRGLAQELAHANAERLRLLRGTVLAQEAERARVARELHDSLGQYMTALRLGLKAVERRFAPDPEACAQIAGLGALTDEVGHELNRLAWELRPTALDDLGLETALRQLVDDWAERAGLPFDLHIAVGARLPPEVETTLYRVLQEAIMNAVKHAGASRIAVILESSESQAQLIVEDDGKGMAPPAYDGQATRRLGLVGMRERLALVRGSLELESTPGKGTTLYARIPL